RGPCQLDQRRRGFRTIREPAIDVAPQDFFLEIGQFFIPFASWRIVVRACIRNCVTDKVLRKIRIVSVTIEGELQNSCTRDLKLIAQQRHVLSDQPQILGDKWQPPQFFPDRLEKAATRAGHPLAGLRCLSPRWYMPRSCETAKMVQANHIYVTQQSANPVDPPSITGRTKRIPVVDRITPYLPCGAEVVGRNA